MRWIEVRFVEELNEYKIFKIYNLIQNCPNGSIF